MDGTIAKNAKDSASSMNLNPTIHSQETNSAHLRQETRTEEMKYRGILVGPKVRI